MRAHIRRLDDEAAARNFLRDRGAARAVERGRQRTANPARNKLQLRAEVNIEKVLPKPNPKNGSRIGPKRRTETVNPQTIGPSETGDLVPLAILVLRNVFGSGLEIRRPVEAAPARRPPRCSRTQSVVLLLYG